METKQFKAESKRLLNLMINSIYTNKEIFLRELISNASDAIDKLYYRSLTDKNINTNRTDLAIKVELDKESRTIKIIDNGCGMTKEELENNLGTIAKSGSLAFKEENKDQKDVDIIGQFGVGFYASFMIADVVRVESKAVDSEKAYVWESKGEDGYTIEETEKTEVGTIITLHIKEDSEEEKYSEYLEDYTIKEIIKKYSDYIRYPIQMLEEKEHDCSCEEDCKCEKTEKVQELKTINSMIPIWKRSKSEVKSEEYETFYMQKFYDYEKPNKVIHTSVEGQFSYNALLFIPSHAPFDYYTKEYTKGLQLYSNGVLIMEKCEELLPDHFSFVKGLIDSQDLSLNISREMLQQDRQLRAIAKNIENKIKSELEKMLLSDREEYVKIFKAFGTQLKFGTYDNYGINKDKLKDLLLFYSSTEQKLVTIKEYFERMKEGQDQIYYACGETVDKIDLLPQVEHIKDKDFEILYLTENVDEFVLKVLMEYEGKKFQNVAAQNVNLDSEEEKETLNKTNEENKDMFSAMKEALANEVQDVRFTQRLKSHSVCLTSEGELSIEMQKVMAQMPNAGDMKAQTILEINKNHEIVKKLQDLYQNDKEELKKYTKILYAQARLIEGLTLENPTEISNLITEIMAK